MLRVLLVWNERVREGTGERHTSVDNGVGTFTDFLVFDPVARPTVKMARKGEQRKATIVFDVLRWPFRRHPFNGTPQRDVFHMERP